MFELQTVGFRNFITFGEKWTRINFKDFQGLTMIQGINHDTVSDSNNGIGKTTILNAISTVITGSPLKKVPNQGALVNRENGKNCELECDIKFFGDSIRIERGFKPSYLRVWHKPKTADPDKEIKSQEFDKTFREKRETETYLENLFGLDIDLIRLVMVSMADADNFFSMKTTDQKAVVERLFNLLLLSEKAAGIKEIRQGIEVEFGKEAARISGLQTGRDRIEARLVSAKQKSTEWNNTNKVEIEEANQVIDTMLKKLEAEEADRENLKKIDELKLVLSSEKMKRDDNVSKRSKADKMVETAEYNVSKLDDNIKSLSSVDIDVLITQWDDLAENTKALEEAETSLREVTLLYRTAKTDEADKKKAVDAFQNKCPTCGQDWPDQDSMDQQLVKLETEHKDAVTHLEECEETKTAITEIVTVARSNIKQPDKSVFATRDLVVSSKATIDGLRERLDDANVALKDAQLEQLNCSDEVGTERITEIDNQIKDIESKVTFTSLSELDVYKSRLEAQQSKVESLGTVSNPHTMTVQELTEELSEDIETAHHDNMKLEIAECKKLESLLTHKSSPLRNAILKEWVPRLNYRVSEYLEKLDFEYQVRFDADLSCRIYDHEKESTFDELSSGEKERVHIALSLAFRDIFEDMYYPINFYAIDERLDSGLCVHGAIKAADVITELATIKNRPTFIITHRNEFGEMVDRIIMVEKKNKYSSIKILDA